MTSWISKLLGPDLSPSHGYCRTGPKNQNPTDASSKWATGFPFVPGALPDYPDSSGERWSEDVSR